LQVVHVRCSRETGTPLEAQVPAECADIRIMNISRLSTPASLPQVATRPPHHQHHHVRAANDGGADEATTQATAADASVQGSGTEAQDHDFSKRVANYASQIEHRVQNAISGGNLSPDQAQALQDASAQFQSLMNRIGNADFSGTPKREVLFALHQLSTQIQSILQPQQTQPGSSGDALAGGSGAAAATSTPTIDTVA
jgi:hypothetical protein